MELIFAHQIGFGQVQGEEFDFFLTASGYEVRSTYLSDNIQINAKQKIALGFDEMKNSPVRKRNDKFFIDRGFEIVVLPVNDSQKLTELIDSLCKGKKDEKLRFLIDYSCMSKIWYAAIIKYFIENESIISNLELYFSYTPAIFSEPKNIKPNRKLSGPTGLLKANRATVKPSALVMGLGYEKYVGESLFNNLNYDTLYVFYSNPAFDNRYVSKVMENNKKVLDALLPERVFSYPIEDLEKTDSVLTSLCLELRLTYHVALLPVGPKPFTLSCLLLAARYPDIEVWDVKAVKEGGLYDRIPLGEPLVCKTVFSNNDESFL